MTSQQLAISNSEMRAFAQCRRRWWLSYCQAWRLQDEFSDPTGAVNIGSQVHLALEAYYGYGLDPLAVLRWSYHDVINRHPESERQLQKDLDMAAAMTEGYLEWLAETGTDSGLEIVDAEHEVTHDVTLPDGTVVTWRGKLDLLVRRMDDGRLAFRDFKTVGSFEKANALLLDPQMRFYVMLQALMHPVRSQRVDGALFMMMKRSKRTQRATGPFYQQAEVSYNTHDLNATWLRALSVTMEIVNARRRLSGEVTEKHAADHHFTVYPNPGDYCAWGCPFYSVCHLLDDGSRWEDAVSARFEHGNPYLYYSTERIIQVLTAFGALAMIMPARTRTVTFDLCIWSGDPAEIMSFIPDQFHQVDGDGVICKTRSGNHHVRVSKGDFVLRSTSHPGMPALFFFDGEEDDHWPWLETLFLLDEVTGETL